MNNPEFLTHRCGCQIEFPAGQSIEDSIFNSPADFLALAGNDCSYCSVPNPLDHDTDRRF